MVDTIVANADEITAYDGNSTLDCVEVDELGFASHRRRQRHIRALGHLRHIPRALSARSLRK